MSTPLLMEDTSASMLADLALRFGTLAARDAQLREAVGELLENLGEIQFDAPKLLERVRLAMDKAERACVL